MATQAGRAMAVGQRQRAHRTIIGVFGDFEYARGRFFVVRRPLGTERWSVYCGVTVWPEHERDLLNEIVDDGTGTLMNRELGLELLISDLPPLTSDNSPLIGRVVDQIEACPHLFAARYLKLERDVADLLERVDGLCAREVL
jgi:hypothetical protein